MPLALSQYMAAVQAAMQPAAIDIDQGQTIMPPETITPGGLAAQPPIAPAAAPAYQSPIGSAGAPVASAPATPQSRFLTPDAFGPGANPIEAGVKLAQQRGDLPVEAAPSAGPTQADAGAQTPQHPFPLEVGSGGGVVPAHEQELRGPSLRGAQGNYNDAVGQAIQAHTIGGAENAGREYAMALEAERSAQARQMAAEQAMAEREEEMLQKQQDFAQSAKALGQFAFKPDGGFWESRTTGQKIAGVFELALNGFMAGVGRPVPSQVTMGIERSIRAQENAYHALGASVNAQQTAFSMAMQKYQNVDAARSHVRVAALEGLQAQAMQVAALNKGNETGMRAMAAIADLEGQKMQQIAQGIRFLPAQAVGRRFIDQNTGLVYTEQEAKALAGKWYEQGFKREEIGLNTAGKVIEDAAKAQHERGAFGPMGKAGAEKLATEEAKTQIELDANLKAVNAAKADVDAITAGGKIGSLYAGAPAWAPGATGAKNDVNTREAYNRRVMIAVGAAYKLGTDAMEPKNREMVEHFAEPFTIHPTDNRDIALHKMSALNKLLADSAAAKGAAPPALPSSITFHGGK